MTTFCSATNHGVKACAEIVRSDEDVVRSSASVPEWVYGGDELHRGGNESACVANRWKTVNGAEVARHVDGDEEEISFVRVKGSNFAC